MSGLLSARDRYAVKRLPQFAMSWYDSRRNVCVAPSERRIARRLCVVRKSHCYMYARSILYDAQILRNPGCGVLVLSRKQRLLLRKKLLDVFYACGLGNVDVTLRLLDVDMMLASKREGTIERLLLLEEM